MVQIVIVFNRTEGCVNGVEVWVLGIGRPPTDCPGPSEEAILTISGTSGYPKYRDQEPCDGLT
jgi:hypothetical protein